MEAKIDLILNKLENLEERMETYNVQIKELKAELTQKEQKWEEEKTMLTDRIAKLEYLEEVREKNKRRKNVIINGLSEEGEASEVVKKLADNLKIQLQFEDAARLGIKKDGKKRPILVKCADMEQKKRILSKKSSLRDAKSSIFIDDDLTRTEREIQVNIKKVAQEERTKGKKVQVFYQKVRVEDELWIWNMKTKALEKEQMGPKNPVRH